MSAGTGNEQLGSYLKDHLAGSTAGLELARHCHDSAADGAARRELDGLVTEVGEDRETLLDLMRQLGVRPDPVRQSLAWLGEKATRLRLGPPFAAGRELARLLELEAMALGVEGKRGLWEALRGTLSGSAAVAGLPLAELAARAARQRELIERHRLAAAGRAFARPAGALPGPTGSGGPSDSTTPDDRLP